MNEISELVQRLDFHIEYATSEGDLRNTLISARDALTSISERCAEAEKVLTDPATFHQHALRNNVLSRMNALHVAGATDYDSVKAKLAAALEVIKPFALICDLDVKTDQSDFDSVYPMVAVGRLRAARAFLDAVSSPVTEKTDG